MQHLCRTGKAPLYKGSFGLKNLGPQEGAYGGTWFPRQIARGPRCGAALHFRRNAAIWGPRKSRAFVRLGRQSRPRPFRAAPRERRTTQGARGSGDRSLINETGAPQKQSFCAVGAAVPPTALPGRAASAASDAGSPKVGRPESMGSPGPPQKQSFCGEAFNSARRRLAAIPDQRALSERCNSVPRAWAGGDRRGRSRCAG